ncbi:D-alanyl-D-alanine carboxypeptidase [Acaryochloris marina]|uniref:D-alanyl-D-alanine carboxypeptidase n=1 Tax=Acaryochloris marina TaxID=155978 RepID=UPI0021C40FCA|nr:D-alanyl-D-alanine carboxypeptidase [Acaryochloris marina]BDM83401.1 hypothetical protein AM10699_62620 [Acaryochloris marina MBIC10699]
MLSIWDGIGPSSPQSRCHAEVTLDTVVSESTPITTSVAEAVNRVRGVEPKFCCHMLALAIDEILEDPRFETAQWGIVVESITGPTVLYQHN